ncbi:MAG: rRNA maturation RNase YbeY [Chitinophagaceae bacterium]|nr:rRNA maturation RNase YbeY [Chitinophagaceae bacterium]
MNIQFFFEGARITLTERTRLKGFLLRLLKRKGKKNPTLRYIFCTDDYLLGINQSFLNHDDYTDIITFDLSENPEDLEGEIYISADRIKENARNLGVTLKRELHRVIFHGALHLCGYKDKTPVDKEKMTREEDKCLKAYFLTVPRGTRK